MSRYESKNASRAVSEYDGGVEDARIETATAVRLSKVASDETIVEGSSRLYANGQRRFVPMPTADPKDPLNLPPWRKAVIIAALCFFGAMALAPEAILAALLPVFALEYAGISPHILDNLNGLAQPKGGGVNPDSSKLLGAFGGPPYWKISLISTLPTLIIGVSNYVMIPISIAVGRRPVIIVCGLMAWIGAFWAAASTSLESHLGARSLMALGAGTVETLLPLVTQDLVFIHWRNRAFSAVWASQGIIVVTLGICSPIIIIATSWRWLYRITGILAAVSWLVILFVLPETRYIRSKAELRGESLEPLPPGALRPALDPARYGQRTAWDEYGVFNKGIYWRHAWDSLLASVKSFFFPNIFWIICINGAFSAISLAAGQTGSLVLMTKPNAWPFRLIGLAVLPIVIASVFVAIFAGFGADYLSNYLTRTRHGGRREPEVHLINLIVPVLFAVAGCIMFGAGGSLIGHISWAVFVVGIGFLAFGVLSTNIICGVYAIEAYPDWAGAVLVNSGSFRNIIGFGFSFRVTTWIGQLGFLPMFGVYAAVVAILGLAGVPVYFYGKRIRAYCGRFVASHEVARGYGLMADGDTSSNEGVINPRKNVEEVSSFEQAPMRHEKPVLQTVVRPRHQQGEQLPQVRTYRSPRAQQNMPPREQRPAAKKGGIDWENVKECLNMRSKWGDPPSH